MRRNFLPRFPDDPFQSFVMKRNFLSSHTFYPHKTKDPSRSGNARRNELATFNEEDDIVLDRGGAEGLRNQLGWHSFCSCRRFIIGDTRADRETFSPPNAVFSPPELCRVLIFRTRNNSTPERDKGLMYGGCAGKLLSGTREVFVATFLPGRAMFLFFVLEGGEHASLARKGPPTSNNAHAT